MSHQPPQGQCCAKCIGLVYMNGIIRCNNIQCPCHPRTLKEEGLKPNTLKRRPDLEEAYKTDFLGIPAPKSLREEMIEMIEMIEAIRAACIKANPADDWDDYDPTCEYKYPRPIRLADVLLAITDGYFFAVSEDGHILRMVEGSGTNELGLFRYEGTGKYWNPRTDDLTAQSDECLKFLVNLL